MQASRNTTRPVEAIVNADDFGLSPGVNGAVAAAFRHGALNSTSLMVDEAFAEEAARIAKENPGLKVGVHLQMREGFVSLLLRSLLPASRGVLQAEAEAEFRRQIDKAREMGISVAHLDSHRHIHMIPALFPVVEKLAAEHGIPRVRVVNESAWHTLSTTQNFSCLLDGGAVKYCLLKFFHYLNRDKSDVYFYSILHTMRLFGRNMQRIRVPKRYKRVEIGIHPSDISLDMRGRKYGDYLPSADRKREFDTVMDKGLPNRVGR